MSRVGSAPVKERCLAAFFAQYPTPTDFLNGNPADMEPLIHSLGLFPDRLAAMTAITQKWMAPGVFQIDTQGEHKIKGAGQFAVDR